MGGINARRKGLQYEREVVSLLKSVFMDCERTQEGDSLDRAGVDIRGTGSLRVQCKRGRGYAPINKIEEVRCSHGIPVLWTKADRKRSVVCLYEDDFLRIIKDIGVIFDESESSD